MTRRTRPMRHARTPVSTGPSRRLTRRGVTVGAVIGLTLSALPAWAYWTSSATTSASASTDTLQPPVTVTPTPTGMTSMQIKVTAGPATGPTPSSYVVKRGTSTICGAVVLNATCTDTGLTPGTTYTYTATSVLQNWTSATASAAATTDPVPAPSKPSLTSASRSGILGETYTSDATPFYTGTALVGSVVTLYVDGSAVGTSGTVPAGGAWTIGAGSPSTNRQHTVLARASYQGGTSADSTTQALVIDGQRPTSGTAGSACAVALVNTFCPGQVTVSVTGSTDPANSDGTAGSGPSYLEYTLNGSSTTQSTTAGSLAFTFAASDGSGYPYTARVRDGAGNGAQNTLSGTTSVTVDRTAPTATDVFYGNGGGTSRQLDAGDTVSVDLNDVTSGVNAKSLCDAWPVRPSTTQTATGLNARISAADVLTLTGAGTCGTVNLGSVSLATNWATTQVDCPSSSLSYNATSALLTITLGGTGCSGNPSNSFGTPTYSPSAAVTDQAGNPISTSTVSGSSSRF